MCAIRPDTGLIRTPYGPRMDPVWTPYGPRSPRGSQLNSRLPPGTAGIKHARVAVEERSTYPGMSLRPPSRRTSTQFERLLAYPSTQPLLHVPRPTLPIRAPKREREAVPHPLDGFDGFDPMQDPEGCLRALTSSPPRSRDQRAGAAGSSRRRQLAAPPCHHTPAAISASCRET